MSETLTERIKYISGIQPDHLISAFASDLDEIIQRAEAAEARAAAKSELIDSILSTWEPMAERLLDAEARSAKLETDNDEMQSYINEIRVALHTEKDELTIDAVRRVISERYELARKLETAQQALRSIEDQAGRAALVQDRSVSIIKQTCKIIADKANEAMTA